MILKKSKYISKVGKVLFIYFFKKFCLDQGPFCGATDCSCFGLRVSFLMGFKSRVDISPALLLVCCDPEGHNWCDTCLFHQYGCTLYKHVYGMADQAPLTCIGI